MESLAKLGIDWFSLLVYIVNFGIIVLICAKWVYKPVLRLLDERREAIEGNLNAAEETKRKFEAVLKTKEQESKEMMAKMKADVSAVQHQAEARAKEVIEAANVQRDQIIRDAQKQAKEIQLNLEKQAEEEIFARINKLVNQAFKTGSTSEDVVMNIKTAWKSVQKEK